MTKKKIAVSLPADLVKEARLAVKEGRASSVSAYVAESMSRRRRQDELAEIVEEMIQQHGRPSSRDRAWARRVLGIE